jgi:2-keto-3-deoxy-galactonokinase
MTDSDDSSNDSDDDFLTGTENGGNKNLDREASASAVGMDILAAGMVTGAPGWISLKPLPVLLPGG